MHRTKLVPVALRGCALLALLCLGGSVAWVSAQEKMSTSMIVPLNSSTKLKAKNNIKGVIVDNPNIVRVSREANSLDTLILTGAAPGVAKLEITDVKGMVETYEVIVQTDVEYLRYILRRIVPTANVEPVPAGSSFILTGTVSRAEDVQVLIDAAKTIVGDKVVNGGLRVANVQQVQIDVMVARVNRSEARTMGFSFLENRRNYFISNTIGGAGNLTGALAPGLGAATAALTGTPNAIFGVLGDKNGFIGFLNALHTEGLAKLDARPSLVTLSGRSAEFVDGGDQAVPTLASGGAGGGAVSGIEFRPFGTTVRVLPIVLGNGQIYLEVEPQTTFPDPNPLFAAPVPGTNSQVFGRTSQRVYTSVIMEPGTTFAIGGLIQRKTDANTTRWPLVGDLPFLGAVFSTTTYQENESELLILVTPRLVDPLGCTQLPKYLPGQETRTPDDFELFLERILEAPRGQRETRPDGRYTPAFHNSHTTKLFPCDSSGRCDNVGSGKEERGPNGQAAPPNGTSPTTGAPRIPGTRPATLPPVQSEEQRTPNQPMPPYLPVEGLPGNHLPAPPLGGILGGPVDLR